MGTQWLIISFSIFVGYLVIRNRLPRDEYPIQRMIDTIENSLIIALVVWKFSLILFEPITVITNPLALLYFSGGGHGIWLAVAIASIYIYFRAQKEHDSIWVYGDLLSIGFWLLQQCMLCWIWFYLDKWHGFMGAKLSFLYLFFC